MKQNKKLDAVEYICDFLPDIVEVKHRNVNVHFQLSIHKNGSKGLNLCYQYCTDYMKEEDVKLVNILNASDGLTMAGFFYELREKFDAPMECLYLCEYIHSASELEEAAKRCYSFLRKHKLIGVREQNVRAKDKLFRVIDGDSIK